MPEGPKGSPLSIHGPLQQVTQKPLDSMITSSCGMFTTKSDENRKGLKQDDVSAVVDRSSTPNSVQQKIKRVGYTHNSQTGSSGDLGLGKDDSTSVHVVSLRLTRCW